MPQPFAPTLVILAAGMGSRYGGLKQLEAVGPGGATLMDYAVHDALRAGFGSVVFVIRPDMQAVFRDVAARYASRLPVHLAFQRLSDLPDGITPPAERVKPWGTAQALIAAEPQVTGSFAIANADDFYGAPAFAAIADFLRAAPAAEPTWAIAGYPLGHTLSEAGPVNRAVCRTGPDGWLVELDEVLEIRPDAAGGLVGRGSEGPVQLERSTPVSMNLWGFTPALFPVLRAGFREFLTHGDRLRGEHLLPTAVRGALARGAARVRVLEVESPWFGITHPDDRPRVETALRGLVAAGDYPERLWS